MQPQANEVMATQNGGSGQVIVECRNITKQVKLNRQQSLANSAWGQLPGSGRVKWWRLLEQAGAAKLLCWASSAGWTCRLAGRSRIAGQDISRMREKQLARVRNRTIGFVFQFFNLVPTLSALENVMLPIQFDKKAQFKPEERAKELLQLVGLGERLNNKPTQLSGGEQQRVAIARALANQPALVVGR